MVKMVVQVVVHLTMQKHFQTLMVPQDLVVQVARVHRDKVILEERLV
jgi:hypothetical protein